MHKFLILGLVLLFCVSTQAQTDSTDVNNECSICFRGKPSPRCCTFLIFESGYLTGVSRSGHPADKEAGLVTGDLGLMFNLKGAKAIGGSIHISADDDGTTLGLGPRYRTWLSRTVSLDISPRIMFGGEANRNVKKKFPGFSVSAALSINDIISFDSYFQVIPYDQQVYAQGNMILNTVSETETGIFLGVSGRSFLAPVLPILAFVTLATAF